MPIKAKMLSTGDFEWTLAHLEEMRQRAEDGNLAALYVHDVERLIKGMVFVEEQRDEAREAAENYHEAWIDAALYWKDKVRRLAEQNERLQQENDALKRRRQESSGGTGLPGENMGGE
jgi:hypothetical protein